MYVAINQMDNSVPAILFHNFKPSGYKVFLFS